MTTQFPRVTYATQGEDLSALHDFLDKEIPAFRAKWLGRHWPNLIDGQASEQGTKYSAFSPIDNETLLGTFVSADTIAVDRAVQAACKQFKTWGHTSWQERVKALQGWVEVLRRRKYDIAIACLLEIGKSRIEALGEADEVLDMVEYTVASTSVTTATCSPCAANSPPRKPAPACARSVCSGSSRRSTSRWCCL